MALEEAIKITVDTNAEEAAQELDKLNKELKEVAVQYLKLSDTEKKSKFGKGLADQMADLQNKIKGVNGENSQLAKSIDKADVAGKTLKSQLRSIKEELAQLEEGSPAFIKLAKQAGDIAGQIEAANNTTKVFKDSLGERQLQGIIGSLSLITSGFGAIQGAMVLLGGQSKELDKVLMQVNATMLVLNSLQQIQAGLQKDSAAYIFITTTAQKAYNAALKQSTLSQTAFNLALAGVVGLGIVAVIYAITTAQQNLASATQQSTKYQNDYNNAVLEAKIDIEAERVLLLQKLAIAKDETQSLKTRQEALQQIKKEQPEYFGNLEIETINTKAATVAVENYTKAMQSRALVMAAEGQLVEIGKDLLTIEQERATAAQKRQKAINETPETVLGRIAEIEYDFKLKSEALNNREIAAKDRLGVLQGIITKNAAEFLKVTAEAIPTTQKLNKEVEKGIEQRQKEMPQLEQKTIDEGTFSPTDDPELFLLQTRVEARNKANDDFAAAGERAAALRKQQLEDFKKDSEETIKTEEAIFNSRQVLYSQTAALFGNLAQVVATQGKGMNDIQKTLTLIQIGIDTASALSSALKATYASTPEPIVAAIRYATVAANIIATAGKIKQVLSSGAQLSVQPPSTNVIPQGVQSTGVSTPSSTPVSVTVDISERDLRRASVKAQERRRGATIVV